MHVVTAKSLKNLELGREKGTNHLSGIPKTQSHKDNISRIMREWCANNPDKVKARGAKTRSENHYQWKGGISRLNKSIRTMTENRKWMEAVKKRDGACLFCGSQEELEADHITPLVELLKTHKITNRTEARACAELWDITNGRTLCRKCHTDKDNRKYSPNGQGRRQRANS